MFHGLLLKGHAVTSSMLLGTTHTRVRLPTAGAHERRPYVWHAQGKVRMRSKGAGDPTPRQSPPAGAHKRRSYM